MEPHEQACTECVWHSQTKDADSAGGFFVAHLCWRAAGEPCVRARVVSQEACIPACEEFFHV